MLARDVYDMQQRSAVCGHCVTPLTGGPLVMRCPASPCPLRFCTRLCLARAVPTHPLLCAVQNPASVPLLAFARRAEWMALHALAQCSARVLLAAQADDAAVLAQDWGVVRALAVLGMEERVRGSLYVHPPLFLPRRSRRLFSCAD